MTPSALPPVGRTAIAAARVRAHESARPDRLFDDWLAGLFTSAQMPAVEEDSAAPEPGRRLALAFHVVIRTRFYDDYLQAAALDGVEQVVVLGAGLDSRAYRLPWPAEVDLYEVDLDAVLDYKREVLAAQPGLVPTCRRHEVRADLAGDWTPALLREGFDPARPTAWLAEGLLVYLEPDAAESLLAQVTTLSAAGSQLALESGAAAREVMGESATGVERLWRGGYAGALTDWLAAAGWEAVTHPLHDIADEFGRPASRPSHSAFVTARRAEDPIVRRLRAAGCVFAEDEARLLAAEAADAQQLEAMVARRESGVPLEVVLGWAEFCGLRIAVDPGVFVPRRRSEFLAQRAVAVARPGAVVVELCCGAGAISAALLAAFAGDGEGVEVHAADIDPVAVRCARRNLAGPGVTVYEGDLYQPLPDRLRGHVDLVIANAPYVPTAELDLLPREARQYEPQSALGGGGDGLEILRRVMAEAPHWLTPGGQVLVEASERQAASLERSIAGYGLIPQTFVAPEGEATVVAGRMPVGVAEGSA